MRTSTRVIRQDLAVSHRSEEGIALVTTLVILLIMTVLGIGAVAVTGLENRIAGFQRTGESATSAAESCVGTSVNIIQQTLATSKLTVPAAFVSATGPVLNTAEVAVNPTLSMEISGSSDNDTDVVTGVGAAGPDYSLQINGYTVLGDIDFLWESRSWDAICGGRRGSRQRHGMAGPISCIESIVWQHWRQSEQKVVWWRSTPVP